MDPIPLMLDDDPFDLTSVNLNSLIYHPIPCQLIQETLATQQIIPTRVPITDNYSSNDRNEGTCVVSNAGDGDLDNNVNLDMNMDPGVENGGDVDRVGKRQKKMVMHREVERQRRQEMAALHASLRSLLPLEYLKGKRSMSDHLNEAVKYINHLKATNQLLINKKDQLIRAQAQNINGTTCTPDSTIPDYHATEGELKHGSSPSSDRVVIVNACKEGGVEVVLRVGQEDKLPLSLILKALAQQGLDVTNCVCTDVGNKEWLHCLQAQAREGISIDASRLQQQLCFQT